MNLWLKQQPSITTNGCQLILQGSKFPKLILFKEFLNLVIQTLIPKTHCSREPSFPPEIGQENFNYSKLIQQIL